MDLLGRLIVLLSETDIVLIFHRNTLLRSESSQKFVIVFDSYIVGITINLNTVALLSLCL